MQRSLKTSLLTIIVVAGSLSVGNTAELTAFDRILSEYESIRMALLHDGLDDVAKAAHRIHRLSQELEGNFDERLTGIRPEADEELRALLPSIRDAATGLSEADALSGARDSFGAMSEALVEYRRLLKSPTAEVAFCPMAGKSWLQPSGEIGNPYYGQSMARCGEFVSQ